MVDLQKYTNEQLHESLVAETAKSINEVKCSLGDLDKVASRLRFLLVVLEELKNRKER